MSSPTQTGPDDAVVAEHIPWDHLTISPPPDRSRLWYSAAVVVALLAVGLLVARTASRPEVTPVATSVGMTQPTSLAVPIPTTVTTTPISEADLLAVDRPSLDRSVAAAAEWIAIEFFSVDPADDWSARVRSAAGIEPASTPDPPGPAAVSYVEWVRAVSVSDVATGRYVVALRMRRLVADDGSTFRRLPVEMVSVALAVDDVGGVRLTAMPELRTTVERSAGPELGSAGRFTGSGGFIWPAEG